MVSDVTTIIVNYWAASGEQLGTGNCAVLSKLPADLETSEAPDVDFESLNLNDGDDVLGSTGTGRELRVVAALFCSNGKKTSKDAISKMQSQNTLDFERYSALICQFGMDENDEIPYGFLATDVQVPKGGSVQRSCLEALNSMVLSLGFRRITKEGGDAKSNPVHDLASAISGWDRLPTIYDATKHPSTVFVAVPMNADCNVSNIHCPGEQGVVKGEKTIHEVAKIFEIPGAIIGGDRLSLQSWRGSKKAKRGLRDLSGPFPEVSEWEVPAVINTLRANRDHSEESLDQASRASVNNSSQGRRKKGKGKTPAKSSTSDADDIVDWEYENTLNRKEQRCIKSFEELTSGKWRLKDKVKLPDFEGKLESSLPYTLLMPVFRRSTSGDIFVYLEKNEQGQRYMFTSFPTDEANPVMKKMERVESTDQLAREFLAYLEGLDGVGEKGFSEEKHFRFGNCLLFHAAADLDKALQADYLLPTTHLDEPEADFPELFHFTQRVGDDEEVTLVLPMAVLEEKSPTSKRLKYLEAKPLRTALKDEKEGISDENERLILQHVTDNMSFGSNPGGFDCDTCTGT